MIRKKQGRRKRVVLKKKINIVEGIFESDKGSKKSNRRKKYIRKSERSRKITKKSVIILEDEEEDLEVLKYDDGE
jgi:hypothetical protein